MKDHNLFLKIRNFFIRLVVAALIFFGFMILTQDFHIFPGLYSSKIWGYENTVPEGIEELLVNSKDGNKVSVWRMRAESPHKKQVALLFHGNAENLSSFVFYQKWLKSLGYSSYSMEYRGYSGRNSGWPSEKNRQKRIGKTNYMNNYE